MPGPWSRLVQWLGGYLLRAGARNDFSRTTREPSADPDEELLRLTADTDQAAMVNGHLPALAMIAETVRRVAFAVHRGNHRERDIAELRALLPAAERVDASLGQGFAPRLESVIDRLARS